MQNFFKSVVVVLFATVLLSACAMSPRSSDWVSHQKFTQAEVFNAAVSAGGDLGYSSTAIDRTTYNLTLIKTIIGAKNMTLTVQVKNMGGVMHVTTFAKFPEATFSGVYDETIKNFHAALFRNLNIDGGEVNNVVIKEAN